LFKSYPICMQLPKYDLIRKNSSYLHTPFKLRYITLIKKKIKFSSYVRNIRVEQLQTHTYMRKGFLIYEEMQKYFLIYEEAVSHI
jgi:hypothetical protein